MKKVLFKIILALLFFTAEAYPQVTTQWVQSNSSMGNGFKEIHLDASGNVFVLGKAPDEDSLSWTKLSSFSPSGLQRFSILDSRHCLVNTWSFDTLGYIYTAAFYSEEQNNHFFILSKYRQDGSLVWSVNDSVTGSEMLKGFAGDKTGNSFLLLKRHGRNVILKYNMQGTYIQTIYLSDTFDPYAIAVDLSGNIIVSGITYEAHFTKCLTLKYNSDGSGLWHSEYTLSGGKRNSNCIYIKPHGNDLYILLSAVFPSNGNDYLVLKYNPTGSLHWASNFNKYADDEPSGIAIDNNSNVIITGNNGTVKLNRKGIRIWEDTTSNIAAITTDKANNIYLTGASSPVSGDMITLKLNSDGKRIWLQNYKGINTITHETGLAVKTDTLFNVYTGGYCENFLLSHGFCSLIKYTQPFIDTSSKRFMPLVIENFWVYQVTGKDSSGYYKSAVLRDTIAEGKKYFYISNFPLPGYSNWFRIDTLTGNLISFMQSVNCSYMSHEKIVDSLVSCVKDTIKDCFTQFEYKTCIDTGIVSILNKPSPYKQFKSIAQVMQSRCYAKDFGIYSVSTGEVNPTVSLLKGCYINGQLFGDTALRYSISGLVQFRDNLQPVKSGKVKALKHNPISGQVIVLDSAVIAPNGYYRFNNVPPDSCDIMAYQDDEILDYVPGFHDSTIYWQAASTLCAGPNNNNVNIFVERVEKQTGSFYISGHIYALNAGLESLPLANTRVYIKNGYEFYNFDITGTSGEYKIDSMLPGTYTFIVDRMGYNPQARLVTLSYKNKDTVDFYLLKYSGVERDFSMLPAKYSLIQNYPNPFNPSTTFTFDIPSTSNVKLTIYDITGREISTLVDRKLNAGRYKINWDASELASGVYLYRIEANNYFNDNKTSFIETKKLVLMK